MKSTNKEKKKNVEMHACSDTQVNLGLLFSSKDNEKKLKQIKQKWAKKGDHPSRFFFFVEVVLLFCNIS